MVARLVGPTERHDVMASTRYMTMVTSLPTPRERRREKDAADPVTTLRRTARAELDPREREGVRRGAASRDGEGPLERLVSELCEHFDYQAEAAPRRIETTFRLRTSIGRFFSSIGPRATRRNTLSRCGDIAALACFSGSAKQTRAYLRFERWVWHCSLESTLIGRPVTCKAHRRRAQRPSRIVGGLAKNVLKMAKSRGARGAAGIVTVSSNRAPLVPEGILLWDSKNRQR